MKEEKRKQHKAIYDDIKNSTIPEQLKVLYMMAYAVELLSVQSFERTKAVFLKHGYKVKDNELLTGINDYCKLIKMASWSFEQRVEPQIIGATWGAEKDEDNPDVPGDTNAYDSFQGDANELIRLVMLYIDRTARNKDGFAKVFKTLRLLPSSGIFNDEDIARFKMRELK